MVELDFDAGELRPRISVIGVGGSGGNAVSNMIRNQVGGVEFVVANTDAQALAGSSAERVVQLGRRLTHGLGAGSRPEIGRAAAEESLAEIGAALDGIDMCFIAAGMGGGTGSGAAPIIARAARMRGILTVGVVTMPFGFEGARRARIAEAGLRDLREQVDTLIVVPNQNLFRIADAQTTFKTAFELADDVLRQGVRGITDLMVLPGLVNLDFADVRTVMTGMGQAMMGAGEASGDDRAIRAAERAISNPLLDDALRGARGLIISIVGGEDLRLMEVDEAAAYIKDMADPEADIIWGSAFDADLDGRIRVSVVATGLLVTAEAGLCRELAVEVPAPAPVIATSPEPEMPAAGSDVVAIEAEADAAENPQPAFDWTRDELQLEPADMFELPAEPAAPVEDLDAPERAPRGPSLFERMAEAARGAMRAQSGAEAASAPDDRLERHAA